MAVHSGLSNVQTLDTSVTDDLTVTDVLTVNGNCTIGNAGTDTLGFYGATAIAQATVTTAVTATASTTQLATDVAAIWTALANLGLIVEG